jgi:hypothetical protein
MSSALPGRELTEHTISTARHTTGYIASGRDAGPLMIFVHGWPELSDAPRLSQPVRGRDPLRPLDGAGKTDRGQRQHRAVARDRGAGRLAGVSARRHAGRVEPIREERDE